MCYFFPLKCVYVANPIWMPWDKILYFVVFWQVLLVLRWCYMNLPSFILEESTENSVVISYFELLFLFLSNM